VDREAANLHRPIFVLAMHKDGVAERGIEHVATARPEKDRIETPVRPRAYERRRRCAIQPEALEENLPVRPARDAGVAAHRWSQCDAIAQSAPKDDTRGSIDSEGLDAGTLRSFGVFRSNHRVDDAISRHRMKMSAGSDDRCTRPAEILGRGWRDPLARVEPG
jgi:hypothetical protein